MGQKCQMQPGQANETLSKKEKVTQYRVVCLGSVELHASQADLLRVNFLSSSTGWGPGVGAGICLV